MAPWLLARGYATIEGDKGMPNGNNDLLNGQHVSQHWGNMMLDLAAAAKATIKATTGKHPKYTYAAAEFTYLFSCGQLLHEIAGIRMGIARK